MVVYGVKVEMGFVLITLKFHHSSNIICKYDANVMTRTFKDKKEMTLQLNLPKTTSNTRALISPVWLCVCVYILTPFELLPDGARRFIISVERRTRSYNCN